MPKHIAYNGLDQLEKAGLIEAILNNQEAAVQQALALRWYGYNGEIAEETPKQKKLRQKASDVKLMLWAIDKIGDIELAKKAFNKAINFLEDDSDD